MTEWKETIRDHWERQWTLFSSGGALHQSGLVVKFVPDEAGGWTAQATNTSEWLLADAPRRRPAIPMLLLQAETLFEVTRSAGSR